MPDLGHSQGEWTHFVGDEEGYCWLTPMRLLEEIASKFLLERCRIENCLDWNSNITTVDLDGVIYGTNTDSAGKIFVRFVANAGNWDVNLYKATGAGGSDLVAHATNKAAGATFALTADNSSGITGTMTIGGSITAEANDRHFLKCFVDFRLVAKAMETDAASVGDENASASYRAAIDAYTAVGQAIRGALSGLIANFGRFALADFGTPTARGRTFLEATDATVFQETQRRDGDGNVVVDQQGLLVSQRICMADETTGGEQDVVKRVPAATAATPYSTNSGVGTISSHTPGEACPEMTITLQCVQGVDTGRLGAEEFEVSYNYLDKGQRTVFKCPVNLRVHQEWNGPLGVGPITLNRTYAKTGDGTNVDLAASSFVTSVDGESGQAQNTDDGLIYVKVVTNGANWNIEFYSSSTYSTTSLVAKATNVATGATFNATAQNSSGLTISWKVGSAPTNGNTCTLNLQPFKVQNASKIKDGFSIDVTVAAGAGAFQGVVTRMFPGAYLNSDTSGSESISDNYVKAGYPLFADSYA